MFLLRVLSIRRCPPYLPRGISAFLPSALSQKFVPCRHDILATPPIWVSLSTTAVYPTTSNAASLSQHGPSVAAPTSSAAPAPIPQVNMKDYAYELPDHLIARYPAKPRGSSRLLVALPPEVQSPIANSVRKTIRQPAATHHDQHFGDLCTLLPSNCHLVFNESKVFCARMFASLPHGKRPVEVMFLNPEKPSIDPAVALAAACEGQQWRCMVRSADAMPGTTLYAEATVRSQKVQLQFTVKEIYSNWHEEGEADGLEVALCLSSDNLSLGMADAFDAFGQMPLPPYLHRDAEPEDRITYQTVYAAEEGSVAAPTAGLHFTRELMKKLADEGIRQSTVTLHVSAGTFRPVTADTIAGHAMHEERFAVKTVELQQIIDSLREGRSIVPVGTTSVRVLESLYWLGVRCVFDADSKTPYHALNQWESYEMKMSLMKAGHQLPSPAEALQHLIQTASAAGTNVIRGATSICIVPGYEFQLCDALITNFHQPDSTLLLLVAALTGGPGPLLATYHHAIAAEYRFLSFGDACLLFNAQHRDAKAPSHDIDVVEVTANLMGMRSAMAAATSPQSVVLAPQGRVLLHSCCAPCSGAMVEEMQKSGVDVTIFFYNPNIHPKEEYELRKEENKRFAAQLGIPFVDADYDAEVWFQRAKGMEFCPERGTRCSMCFDMRFERTALYAAENGFQTITTTNATSRWKDADQVNESGIKAAAKYEGIQWWIQDWQTEEMSQRKYRINAEQHFYKQEYCGCSYSLRDTNQYRKREGLPPVVIGGSSYFSDPEKDSEEESPEKVRQFFADANSEEQERQRKLREEFRRRRKDARHVENNNW